MNPAIPVTKLIANPPACSVLSVAPKSRSYPKVEGSPTVRGAGRSSAKEERGAVYRCLYGAFRSAFEVRASFRSRSPAGDVVGRRSILPAEDRAVAVIKLRCDPT